MPFTLSDIIEQIDIVKFFSGAKTSEDLANIKTELLTLEAQIEQIKLLDRIEDVEQKAEMINEAKKIISVIRFKIVFFEPTEKNFILEEFCYETLVMLTALKKYLKKKIIDPVTKEEIADENQICLSTGNVYNIHTLIQFMDKDKRFFLDPQTDERFEEFDQKTIRKMIQEKSISSQLILSPILAPTFSQKMLDPHGIDVSDDGLDDIIIGAPNTPLFQSSSDVMLVRFDSSGSLSWTRPFGVQGTWDNNDLDESGGFGILSADCGMYNPGSWGGIVSGRSDSFGVGSSDIFLIKSWNPKILCGNQDEYAYQRKPSPDELFDKILPGLRQHHADFEAQNSSSDTDPGVALDDYMPAKNNQSLAIIPYNTNKQIIPYAKNPFQFFQGSRSSQTAKNVSLENNSNEEENSNEYSSSIAELTK